MLALRLEPVQSWIGERVSEAVSEKLGTEATIGRIDLGFLNRVIIDDAVLKDQQQNELLRISRMTARIDLIALADGRIRISSAQLFGAHAALWRDSANASPNYQFVLDSLASRDSSKHTPLDLAINSLIIRRSSVSYDQKDAPQSEGLFNTKHININNISAHILLKALKDDSLNINVKRLTAKERSGIDMRRLAFQLEAGSHGALLEGLTLQMPRSLFYIDSVRATYETGRWHQPLWYKGTLSQTRIVPSDFSALLPVLKDYHQELSTLLTIQGTDSTLSIPHLLINETKQQLSLAGSLQVTGINSKPEWHANVEELSVGHSFVEQLRKHNPKIPEILTRLGSTKISAQINSDTDKNIEVFSNIATDIGKMTAQLQIDTHQHFSGVLKTKDLQLNQIVSNEQFGNLAADAFVEGNSNEISIKGDISQFVFKKYPYTGISLDGTYAKGDITGRISIDDPNLTSNVEGSIKKDRQLHIRTTGYIDHLAPQALNLNDRWGNKVFSAILDADFTATTLNDAEGSIDLDDLIMQEEGKVLLHLENFHLKSGYNDGLHFVKLSGDPIEAELKGQFDWNTLPQTFIRLVATRLPTLPGLPEETSATNNDFEMNLHVKNSYWLEQLLGVPLQLHKPVDFRANVSDKNQDIDIDGIIPSFTYNGVRYDNGSIKITAPGDTMLCNVQLTRHQANGQRIKMGVNALAANNNLESSIKWDNISHSELFSGELNAITSLYRNLEGQAEAHVRIQPSHLMMQQAPWEIEPCDILYSPERLLVDHFMVRHDERHVTIDGIAGAGEEDSLEINLQDVDIAYVQDMLNFHPVDFGGNVSGTAYLYSAFNEPEAYADLIVNRFTFQGGRMGTLNLHAALNQELKQIDLHAIADDGPGSKTYIDGFVSPQRSDIDLGIQATGTHIDFLHSFTDAFLDNIDGQTHGNVRLAGPLGAMNLTGQLVVNGKATVTPLGTTYKLENDTVNLIPDHILLDSIPLYDRLGNTGFLSGSIDHQHLTNLTFDLDVKTERILAYDIPQQSDQSFYGTIMAQGQVDLHGRPGETTINADVTPLDNTVFTYNVASPDAITSQEFIIWRQRGADQEDDEQAEREDNEEPTYELPVSQPSSNLILNLAINANPQAQLRLLMDAKTGDYITLRGNGALRSTYHNKRAFQLFGTYVVESGTYDITIQNIISKRFQFQDGGTIIFGGEPFDAALNLQALYTVPAVSLSDLSLGESFSSNTIRVNCLMNITGTAEQPLVDFDLEMPTVNADEQQMIRSILASQEETRQQVVYLLGIGRFYTAGINNAESQQQDRTQLAMQSFLSGTLSTQFSQLLSQVIKTDQWNIGANISTGTEGWKNADYEGTISGRMLDNRLLFNGQFGYRDNVTQATPSFIGDFDLRYLLTTSGNLALKVYNQTNDRYFTRSSLNTQGIGLIMKKDFNGLRELLSIRRKRTK